MSGTRWSLRFACTLVVVALAGCQEPEEIRHYTVAREPRIRMLGAIFPRDDSAWFVKVAGEATELEEHTKAFRAFVTSFRFQDKSDPPVSYDVPGGWLKVKDQPKGEFKDRFATFYLRPKDKKLELTITKLAGGGDTSSILANVNRWRGQVRLPPVSDEQLPSVIEIEEGKERMIVLVDMTGFGRRLAAPAAPFAHGGPKPKLPRPDRPVGQRPLTYKLPEGWREAPLTKFSVATFRTGPGPRAADVTISPVGGGVVENINRWRDQLSLPARTEGQIHKDLREIEMAAGKAVSVELVGVHKKTREPTAILGAVAPHGGTVWYFKMTGPPDVVAGQRVAFETFMRSVRFEERKGEQ
ncbi:MAG: hypothetical protein L0Z62_23290 [Gemmataceae bacterium]|nr:hypothetical protein [Gemmataceae bacterium]